MTSFRLGLLAGLVLPLGLATASFAQPPAPPAPPPAADDGMHHHDHHGDPAQHRAHMAEHLRSVLQLTSAQDGALNAFLDAMKPPGGDMDHHGDGDMDHHDHDADQHLTTPARLDKMLAHFDEMRTRMVAKADAVKTFYAQLSAPQQLAFDSLAPMMMGRGGHEGRGDGDGGGHDGMHHHGEGGDDRAMGPDGPPQG